MTSSMTHSCQASRSCDFIQLWAGDLDLTDPLVSPLYGLLAGLPPTAVYFGNLNVLSPDVLVLQDNVLATPDATSPLSSAMENYSHGRACGSCLRRKPCSQTSINS